MPIRSRLTASPAALAATGLAAAALAALPAGAQSFGTAISVIDATGDEFLLLSPLTVTAGVPLTDPVDGFIDITSSIIDNADGTRTLTITWLTNDGLPLIDPGDTAPGGSVFTGFFFDLGEGNAPPVPFLDPDFIAVADPADPDFAGGFLSPFEVLDVNGDVILTTPFFVTDFGIGFTGFTNIATLDDSDISTFGIAGGRVSITYFAVPTPGAAAALGIAALATHRRRRR